jgi:cyclophilin family peptidyl-prolyl cis-trans isomerase
MPNRRTRNRQLARLAQQRYAERRRHERQRRLQVIAVALVVGLVGLGVAGFTFGVFGPETQPGASPSGSPTQPASGAGLSCPKRDAIPPGQRPTYEEPPEMMIDTTKTYVATMHTSEGTIVLDLFADRTPVTVNNFVTLACDGFYDRLTFHRIVPGFVIQGGDPKGDGTGGPGYQFQDEIVPSLTFDGPGLLAMANSGPNTNGSQFFITLGPAEHLNGKHTIFGEVAEGKDVVDAIAGVELNGETPAQPVFIEKISIDESR